MIVAGKAGQAEVFACRKTAMLLGDDVVDFVNNIPKLLWHLAVLASRSGALPNQITKLAVH